MKQDSTLNKLSNVHFDVLKEIGNIGSGNAATALAGLLGDTINISVPEVQFLSFKETMKFVGKEDELVSGLLLKFFGEISGLIMYILQEDFIKKIVEMFFGKQLTQITDLDEMDKSALCEIGNIMAGSYINAIAELTGMKIDMSVPSLCVDMVGAILSVPAVQFAELGDKVLLINDNLRTSLDSLQTKMLLIPDVDSLPTLFGKLGIEI